ncbi:LOW QUALITY PROTEIN: heat shock transcription factor, X-linked-like [Dugong dugon]
MVPAKAQQHACFWPPPATCPGGNLPSSRCEAPVHCPLILGPRRAGGIEGEFAFQQDHQVCYKVTAKHPERLWDAWGCIVSPVLGAQRTLVDRKEVEPSLCMDSRSPPGRGPGSGMALSPPKTWAPQIGCEDPAPPAVLAQAWDNRLPPGCPIGRFLLQETAFETPTKRPSLKRPRPSPDTLSARKGILFPLPFPKKLNIVSSDQFVSIWWECNSTCVGINEKLFQKEILEREGADKVFVTQRMKSFPRQLNLYIFSKGYQIAWRPVCHSFFTEERAVCALSKLHFSCCPYFQRDFPELLLKMKIRVGITAASKTVLDMDSQQVESKPEARRSPSAPAAPDAVAAAPTQLPFVVHTGDAAQMGSSGLMVGLPPGPPRCHSSPIVFLPWVGLLPVCCPWVPVPIRAAGPAVHRPVSSPPAMLFHCWANCPCFSGYMAPIITPGCPAFRDSHR